MDNFKRTSLLFWSFVILAPLLGAILAPFTAFPISGLIISVLFFGVMDIGHKYLGIYAYFYSYYNPKDLKYLLAVPLIAFAFTLGFYFQFPQLWTLFFYIIVVHMFWQMDWFYARLLKNGPYALKLRVLLMTSLFLNLVVIHLSPDSLISIYFQKGPTILESQKYFQWGMLIDTAIYFLTIIYFLKLSFQGKEKRSSLFYFIVITFFYRFIYYTPFLGGDPILVVISTHTLPFIYFVLRDLNKKFQPTKKSIFLWFTLVLIIFLDYEYLNEEADLGLAYLKYKPSFYLSFLPGILIGINLLHFISSYFLRRRIPTEVYHIEMEQ